MIHFVLAHGFGFTDDYWRNLRPLLPGTCSMLGQPLPPLGASDIRVGVGHSLGFIHLIRSGFSFNLLVGLQTFLNFCGTGEERQARLSQVDAMIRLFRRDASHALAQFYQACGYHSKQSQRANAETLIRHLGELKEVCSLPRSPALIVATRKDPIVPIHLVEENFSNSSAKLICLEEISHHSFGFLEASLAARLIEEELCVQGWIA